MSIDESIFSKLTEEQKKRAKAAKSPEELLAVAREVGYELSQSQLDALAGGWCPDCDMNIPGPCGPDFGHGCSPYCDTLV